MEKKDVRTPTHWWRKWRRQSRKKEEGYANGVRQLLAWVSWELRAAAAAAAAAAAIESTSDAKEMMKIH